MAISATLVKQLRDKTGAGFMQCKEALTEADGNLEEAQKVLRKKGLQKADTRSGRTTAQGVVASYIHPGGQVGVLVEVNCESDFVARTDDFQALVREVAMHIAAANPACVSRDQVPAGDLEKEREIYRAQFEGSGKPPEVVDRIVEGKLNSYYEQSVLLEQPSIRDPKTPVQELVKAAIAKMGENITIARFARFKVGDRAE